MNDPSTGPISRETLQELVAAPFGEATKIIRQYDPQWGRADGEKFKWRVQVERSGADTGVAYIEAANKEEANKLADELTECDVEWNYDSDSIDIVSVEPDQPRKIR